MLSQKISKVRQLSWAERWLLLEATIWLAVARLSLLIVPFRRIAPRLGQTTQESTSTETVNNGQKAERIGWAVRAIARRTPWESACLAQAISAKAMLRRRHISSTLYLGLAKDKSQQMQAHAWLRCGEAIITGKAGHERFSVISFFAEPAPAQKTSERPLEETNQIQELLLASLNPTHSAETAVQLKSLDEDGWAALVKAANKQHVLTLFFAKIQALGVETAVPPHLLSKMQQRHQQVTLQNMAIYRELHLIHQEMEAAEIPMIVLKGAYLATAVYPHIGQRAMGDIDLLVSQEALTKMIKVLHALGWQENRALSLNATLEQHHHLPPFAKTGPNFLVEPHWNIMHPGRPYSVSADEIFQHTMPYKIAGSEMLAFQPHLQLLHLALHAAYNHQFAFDLRSLCDIAQLTAHTKENMDWEKVAEQAIAWRWQRGVYLTLCLVREFWPETAVPPHVLVQLKPANLPNDIVELAKEQLLSGRINNKKVSPNFAKLQENKPLVTKAKFALSFLFPTRRRLSWRYGVPEHSAKIWLYYFINFRDMIARNAKRSWQLLNGTSQVVETAERRNQLSEWLTQN